MMWLGEWVDFELVIKFVTPFGDLGRRRLGRMAVAIDIMIPWRFLLAS